MSGSLRNSHWRRLVEAEPPVEVLGPVLGVGHEEHRVEAVGRGRVGRREHRRAGVAAVAVRLERAHLVDLAEPVGALAAGTRPASSGGEAKSRAPDAAV